MKIESAAAVLYVRDTGHRTEDGEAILVDDYQIWATLANGRRFCHFAVFAGSTSLDDEGFSHRVWDDPDRAAKAEAFAKKIEDAGEINLAHWSEIDAAYGSEAWQDQDAGGYFAAREKQEDLEA